MPWIQNPTSITYSKITYQKYVQFRITNLIIRFIRDYFIFSKQHLRGGNV